MGSIVVTSPSRGFTHTFDSSTLAGDSKWHRGTFAGWTKDSAAADYGVWTAGINIASYLDVFGVPNGNYASLYFANFEAAANPPIAAIPASTFRLYLPTEAGAAPVKPYVSQHLTFETGNGAGPNPPVVGQPSRVRLTVNVANPTAHAITFSNASHLVTTNVPGAGAVFAGSTSVSQGTVLSQPALNGTGNVAWDPGVVLAGTTAKLHYLVTVKPTSAGQRLLATAAASSGHGTQASYVEEDGRTTLVFGPLCEVAVNTRAARTNLPAAVAIAST